MEGEVAVLLARKMTAAATKEARKLVKSEKPESVAKVVGPNFPLLSVAILLLRTLPLWVASNFSACASAVLARAELLFATRTCGRTAVHWKTNQA